MALAGCVTPPTAKAAPKRRRCKEERQQPKLHVAVQPKLAYTNPWVDFKTLYETRGLPVTRHDGLRN